MRTFTGMLDTHESGTDAAFRVKLYVTDERLEVATFDGDSWQWPIENVTISRVKADRYRLNLGDEALYFLPDDPLSFTLRFSPNGADGERAAKPERGWLRKRIAEAAVSSTPFDTPSYIPERGPSPSTTRFGIRGAHNHIWEKTESGGATRRRCTDCGHVSIDLSGVKSSLGSVPA